MSFASKIEKKKEQTNKLECPRNRQKAKHKSTINLCNKW